MFSIADLDTTDNTIEVIASQFFNRKLTLHSIQRGTQPKVTFRRVLDSSCGAPYCSVLADLDARMDNHHPTRSMIESGSSLNTLQHGDCFSHILVTNHEGVASKGGKIHRTGYNNIWNDNLLERDASSSSSKNNKLNEKVEGGSLFCYRVPQGKDAWKTEPWEKTAITTGICVREQLWSFNNPGAPGFCYTFYPRQEEAENKEKRVSRPYIAIAGDCANKAIILQPCANDKDGNNTDPSYRRNCR